MKLIRKKLFGAALFAAFALPTIATANNNTTAGIEESVAAAKALIVRVPVDANGTEMQESAEFRLQMNDAADKDIGALWAEGIMAPRAESMTVENRNYDRRGSRYGGRYGGGYGYGRGPGIGAGIGFGLGYVLGAGMSPRYYGPSGYYGYNNPYYYPTGGYNYYYYGSGRYNPYR